ncbi:hypothetical protein CHCC20335_3764 [Bacillus paralicheniformis]|nr:hypothetical protein CHCC20335_3764 [Bacillus paralicheniformis]
MKDVTRHPFSIYVEQLAYHDPQTPAVQQYVMMAPNELI